ncbi:MAG: response regulator [Candidatus Magasanikbacteria bacterium]|nr:response regulator [Candidatus Magasanikbacteria bacterium]
MKKILLVEDDVFLKQLYSDLLTQEKYTFTSVDNGTDAYIEIKKGDWDLILLDVMLPGMTGFEIFNKIQEEKISIKKLVFMTNLDSSDKDRSSLEKADEYWIKSNMTPPDFLEKVKKILG